MGENGTSDGAIASPKPQIKQAVKWAEEEFQEILEDVRATPHHVQLREQRDAYKRLMDHLDGLEKKRMKYSKYWRRLGALLVFSGLTAALVGSLKVEPANHWRLLKQRLWQWVAMTIMVTGVFSVVPFLTFLFTWPAKRYWKTSKYAVYFIRRMKRSVDVTIWSCIVLTGWYLWFRRKLKHVYGDVSVVAVSQVTRFLIALCIGTLLWSIKKALHLKLKADLHYDQLFDRITQSIIYLNGVNVLDGEKRIPVEFLAYNHYEEHKLTRMLLKLIKTPIGWLIKSKESNDSYDCKNIWMDVKKMRREKVPIWILQRLTEEYLKEVKLLRPDDADLLLKNDEKLLEKAKQMLDDIVQSDDHRRKHLSEPKYGLSEEELDEFFKRKRYERVKKQNISAINQDDERGNNSHDQEVQENEQGAQPQPQPEPENDNTSRQGDGTSKEKSNEASSLTKPIPADKFINWAVRAHKNCWSLEPTLESSKTAFVKLNRMMSAFLLVLVVIIWLLLSKIVTTAQLALLFAPFLAASFMFENSSMKMFHGIIFAFAMHPFDVGDRVIIEDTQMRVKELNIMTSQFIKYDTGAEVIFPNSKLVNTKIVNLDITPDQSDMLEFIIEADAPLEDVKDLELKIQKLLDDHLFYSNETKVVKSSYPVPAVEKKDADELKMVVHFKYLVSYLTAETKATRRSEILSMIMKFRKEMEENKKNYTHQDHVKYDLEVVTPKNVKLSSIEQLKHDILSSLKEKKYEYCKVVMTDILKDGKLKMRLFVSQSQGKPLENERVIRSKLQATNFFTRMDQTFSEYGYKDLKVFRRQILVYPASERLRNTTKKMMSLKGRQDNPTTEMEQQLPAVAVSQMSCFANNAGTKPS